MATNPCAAARFQETAPRPASTQVTHAAGAARAALEADDAFDRRYMAEAPEAEGVFQIGKFFAELVEVKILFRVAVHDQPGLRQCFAARSSGGG